MKSFKMNIDNLKKAARIDKKIVYRKLKNKLTNNLLDKLYRMRDGKVSTYSYDYISYFRIDYSKSLDIIDLLEIEIINNDFESFSKQCLQHNHRVLSDSLVSINSETKYSTLQKKFNPKLIPFSTQCFNKISDGYKLIDWQKDYNSNYNWEFKWFKDIKYGNNSGNDIKVPWEIGRLQHLPMLAMEYISTDSTLLLEEIKNQIFDFMASNPPNFGVQWMTSMDIGIRLVNLLFTFFTINRKEQLFDRNELELIDSYLFDHYLHIKENIEFSEGMRGNHYLSNICSLIIYISFTDDNEGKRLLLVKYKRLLEEELDFQFNDDGTNFEGSTRYHIFTNQMIMTVDIILKKYGLGQVSTVKMNSIVSFTSALLEYEFPPQIGDNDSGFFWKLLDSEKYTYDSIKKLVIKHYEAEISDNYINFGYIQKIYDKFDLIFKCGKLGQKGKGGHDHNDNLSYQLYIEKQPFIVDIGSFCYTSDFDQRNTFRSTRSHNALWIEGIEQNEFSNSKNDDMFWLDTDISKPNLKIIEKDKLSGSIEYIGKIYNRSINVNSEVIAITDNYNSSLQKEINIYLFPDINVEFVENNVYKLWNEKNKIYFETDATKISIDKYEFSPQYGIKQQSNKIVLLSSNNIITHKFRVTLES
ncbi:MAG: hypothetical protein CVV25_08635 [Ignavibacteriae bacterium HGW-Ignavibacteriae-4]|nr:MAG: hypothetical protein CVV25_08635 [Ignavibacteriae bacterium HGW-Ignavibacteriae-4]